MLTPPYDNPLLNYRDALEDFYQARRKASISQVLARLRGEEDELLSYEDVRRKLHLESVSGHSVIRDIPLDAIVGSVNRYEDFTRDFLPKSTIDPVRWAQVKQANARLEGLPPIEVFKVGEVYFVNDGNHRVSVARELGATTIQAYVTDVKTRVNIWPGDRPDDLILKAQLADFLEQTQLDQSHPAADLTASMPEAYCKLLEHIAVHQYFMGLEGKTLSYPDAASHWYETYYLPLAEMITALGLPRDFPEKTLTDLYLWLCEYRSALEVEMGSPVAPEAAAVDMAEKRSPRPARAAVRIGRQAVDALLPDAMENATHGSLRWLKEHARPTGTLFADILVPVNGAESGWFALDQAIQIASHEQARLHGLHVVSNPSALESSLALSIQAEFDARCLNAGIQGSLSVAVGEVARQITQRAALNDLVIVNLAFPPGASPVGRLASGFRTVVQRSPRPVLAVPQITTSLKKALLAFDGSATAREALYIAATLAGKWQLKLVVLSITQGERVTTATAQAAMDYLAAHNISAEMVLCEGPIASSILSCAESPEIDLIIMGGYGKPALFSFLIDTVADQVLRHSLKPMLLCR